jgi:hypothetical protein
MPTPAPRRIEMSQIMRITAGKILVFGAYGSAIILCPISADDTNNNRYGARIAPGEKPD